MEGSGEAMKRKVLKQKAVDVQKLFLAISDELGTKACIFMVDDKGNINCKSSLAAPGFHLLLENNVVKTLLTTHVTAGSGSSELMMTVDNSMRSDKSKTEFIRSIVYDLQLRRDPRRGETPIIPRSRFDQSRSQETSRMSKDQLTTVLMAYAKEEMRMPRSVRPWLESKHGLPLRNSMSRPESFCTQAVSNKLASFTKPRRADDGRRRDNADDSKMTAWRKRGASNLNTKKNQNNPSSQQQLHDEDNDDDANVDGRELPVDDDDVEEQLGLGQGSSEEEVEEDDEQQTDNKQKNDGQKDDDDAQKDEQKDDEEEEEEKKEVDIDDDEDDFSLEDHRRAKKGGAKNGAKKKTVAEKHKSKHKQQGVTTQQKSKTQNQQKSNQKEFEQKKKQKSKTPGSEAATTAGSSTPIAQRGSVRGARARHMSEEVALAPTTNSTGGKRNLVDEDSTSDQQPSPSKKSATSKSFWSIPWFGSSDE